MINIMIDKIDKQQILISRYNIFFTHHQIEHVKNNHLKYNERENYENIVRVCFLLGEPIIGKHSAIKIKQYK